MAQAIQREIIIYLKTLHNDCNWDKNRLIWMKENIQKITKEINASDV